MSYAWKSNTVYIQEGRTQDSVELTLTVYPPTIYMAYQALVY